MKEPEQPSDCKSAWQRLVDADHEYMQAQDAFFTRCKDSIVEALRVGLAVPKERRAAFRILSLIKDLEKRKPLFPDLIELACQPSYIPTIISAREAICALPREWVLAHLEREAASRLDWNDDWEFRRFLELCSLIDRELTIRVARNAISHQDPEISEAGKDFLDNPSPIVPAAKS